MGYKGVFLTANFATLALGSLVLSPTFAPTTYAYTTNSTNVSDTLSYTTADAGAEVTLKLNNAVISSPVITWTNNTDTVKATVTVGGLSNAYTITCTHTA